METRDADLNIAKSQHDERMASALKFLKTSGVPDKDVQTDFISVSPEYGNDLARTKPVVYIVRKSIEIKLTTVTNLESVLPSPSTSKANSRSTEKVWNNSSAPSPLQNRLSKSSQNRRQVNPVF